MSVVGGWCFGGWVCKVEVVGCEQFFACFCCNKPMVLDNDDLEPSVCFDRRYVLTCL